MERPNISLSSLHHCCRNPNMEMEHFKNKIDNSPEASVGIQKLNGRKVSAGLQAFGEQACGSGLGGGAGRVSRPVAIKPGHAPCDALVVASEAAVLDDR